MTAQLSRERLEEIIGVINAGAYGYSVSAEEIGAMARMLLAGMDSEPVAYMIGGHYLMHAHDPKVDNYPSAVPLYTAPPAPISDENSLNTYDRFFEGWNACRTTMLKAGPVAGWIKCSERMPEEGGRYWCYVEEQNSLGKSHYQWNCSWNGDEWSDKALTGRVTHWTPLPAAPEQE